MLDKIKNIFKIEDLRNRIFFTLSLLIVFRIGAHITIPGIDSQALKGYLDTPAGGVLDVFNTFSGGAFKNLSIFALGILPYISASIIMQLLTAVFPFLERIAKEGESGRKKITQYTRLGTIFLSIVQGFGISAGIQRMSAPSGLPIVVSTLEPWLFSIITVITLTAGTAFVMWLGEQINERGIGNGISLIIFAGIITGIPSGVYQTIELFLANELTIIVLISIVAIIVAVIFAVIFIETAQRRLPVNYAKRMQGRQQLGAQSTHLPLKINASGVIPPIFASSLLAFPVTITTFFTAAWIQDIGQQLTPGRLSYNLIFVVLIFFFCFFYTAIQFNPLKISDDLKNHGGYIAGIRPGEQTANYLNLVITRLTFGGAIYLSIICILPSILYLLMNVPFLFGGTSVLIVVGVALDLSNQIENFLINQNYDGFIRKNRKRRFS